MRSRVGRIATTAILAAGVGVSSVVFTAPLAEAAQPVVAGDCNATVTGAPGQPVSLDLGAVLGLGSGPMIPVGVIPQTGAKAINAAPMVKQAAADKGLLGGLVGGLTTILANGCAVTAKAVNTAAAPVQQAAKPVTDAAKPLTTPVAKSVHDANTALQLPDNSSDTPNTPSQPTPGTPPSQPGGQPPAPNPGGVPNLPLPGQTMPTGLPDVFSPAALYNSIPLGAQGFGAQGFGVPGSFAPPPGTQYGLEIPGYAPSSGQLGAPPAAGWANADPVRNAGSAEALATPKDATSPVGLPLLLAVLALAGVTAALVRTYLLRRVRG